jgi:hypothetical protein
MPSEALWENAPKRWVVVRETDVTHEPGDDVSVFFPLCVSFFLFSFLLGFVGGVGRRPWRFQRQVYSYRCVLVGPSSLSARRVTTIKILSKASCLGAIVVPFLWILATMGPFLGSHPRYIPVSSFLMRTRTSWAWNMYNELLAGSRGPRVTIDPSDIPS